MTRRQRGRAGTMLRRDRLLVSVTTLLLLLTLAAVGAHGSCTGEVTGKETLWVDSADGSGHYNDTTLHTRVLKCADGDHIRRSFIKATIPTGFTKVTLDLTATNVEGGAVVGVYAVSGSWSSGTTWPGPTMGTELCTLTGTDHDVDVTSAVSGGVLSVGLKMTNEACAATTKHIDWKNVKIVVDYASPTAEAGADQSKCYTGSAVTFNLSGSATGTGTLSYRWTGSGVDIDDDTTLYPKVSFKGPATKEIKLTVTDTHGATKCTQSDTVNLTVSVDACCTAPAITANPAGATKCPGQTAQFSVTATGTGLSYQWQVESGSGFANIIGATSSLYTTPVLVAGNNGNQYRCVVTGACGTATSNAATLTVNTPPTITAHPAGATKCPGQTAQFSVTATGTGLSYQWQVDSGSGFGNISGANSSSYTTPVLGAGNNGSKYRCVVSGTCNPAATSNAATLTVDTTAPVISALPALSTIECPLTPSFATPTATDACDAAPGLTSADVTTPGSCANAYSVTRTWTATDACSNSSTASQTINVQDITAPAITCPADVTTCSDVGLDYATGVAVGTASASDTCDPSPAVTGVRSDGKPVTDDSYPVGTTTITWTGTDDCGNTNTCTQTVRVRASPRASISPDPAQVYAKVGLPLDGNPTGGSGTYTAHAWTGLGATHLSATNIENPLFTADALGSYPLTYTVTDSNGCVGYDDIVVQVINATPVAQYQSLTTCKNAALAIPLMATDPQLDPLDPTLHPLTFAINGAPSNGSISGNLGAVTYTAPHAASVTVTYTPRLDFLGTDTFTFMVTDPFGAFGIGTITVTVQECKQVAGGGAAVATDVVINEVAWGGTPASIQDEWIELRNNTDQSIDLTDWMLRWRRKHPATPEEEQWKSVNLSGTIAPYGYYLLEREHEETVSDVTANLIYDTTPPYHLELNDLGEVIQLLDTDGDVVDTSNADHPERDGWIAGAGPDGVPPFGTLERIDPVRPDTDDNWATNRHLIVNGLDALTDVLTATAVMVNENTLFRTLGGETAQVVQVGEQLTITVEFPLTTEEAEGLPQVILAQMNAAAGGGGAVLEPSAQAAALSSRRVGGAYELSLDTSALAPGTYGLWLSMGNGVFHGLVFEVVED